MPPTLLIGNLPATPDKPEQINNEQSSISNQPSVLQDSALRLSATTLAG
jgi:hypothetical protein